MMETVIVMPIMLLLIFGIIQFAHIWIARQMVAYAAFCATRAIMVVPPDSNDGEGEEREQTNAAEKAAEMALSWINFAGSDGNPVMIPGWGAVGGSETSSSEKRIKVQIVSKGSETDKPVAAVQVTFKFPLMIPAMAVNKIIASAASGLMSSGASGDFYADLDAAAGSPDTIDGWPCLKMKEVCVLPMPYSTANFPKGAFDGVNIREE